MSGSRTIITKPSEAFKEIARRIAGQNAERVLADASGKTLLVRQTYGLYVCNDLRHLAVYGTISEDCKATCLFHIRKLSMGPASGGYYCTLRGWLLANHPELESEVRNASQLTWLEYKRAWCLDMAKHFEELGQ